ncbi:MAG: class I SAM-dependent methyltransferase [Proteobacteria bacterium]|nr:class I SAM-dependent methyltransferase [Pseudomonadota bacterium]
MAASGRLYWFGNAAKARIVAEIMARPGPLTIFDYGAGTGGDWPEILRERPDFRLVCYEPHAPSVRRLEERLQGLKAEVHAGDAIATLAVQADVIVSFSVLAQVYDRPAYFAHAARCLAPGGVFYLNYDDGHFRQKLDLNTPGAWVGPLKEHLGNLGGRLWARLGRESWHQRPAAAAEVEALAKGAGLKVTSTRYENLASLKALAKTVPPEKQQAFARFWIETETRLNADFAEAAGGETNLWREMGSRTTTLVRA